jgi:Ner family transcriptional regulator
MTQKGNWHSADIIAALRKKGTSLRQLSLKNNLNERTLSQALQRPYPKAEQIIAEAVGEDRKTIWPQRFNKSSRKPNVDKTNISIAISANKEV